MGQVNATAKKTAKEFFRERAALFWVIGWPIIWVLIGSFVFVGDAPESEVPLVRGSITISMMFFSVMIAAMASVPGNIAGDRERGLLSKLRSMPVKPWKDITGRILGLLIFSSMAAGLVLVVGHAVGARLSLTPIEVWQSVGFFLIVLLTSAGIGMVIGTLVKHVQGAIMTGLGISVLTASISGIFAPYSALPTVLQWFSRVYPISSANSSILFLSGGEKLAGYNPLTASHLGLMIGLSILLFAIGLTIYSKLCWGR